MHKFAHDGNAMKQGLQNTDVYYVQVSANAFHKFYFAAFMWPVTSDQLTQTGTYFRKIPKTCKPAGRRQALIALVLQPLGPAAAGAAALGLYEATQQ